MALVFLRNLKNPSWFNGNELPSVALGTEGNHYFRIPTQTIFRKFIPTLSGVVFDKNSKSNDCTLTENYKGVSGPTSTSQFGGVGVKSLPLIEDPKLVFSIRINSLSTEKPIIGFCDKSSDLTTGVLSNVVALKLGEANVRYIRNNKIEYFSNVFDKIRFIKTGDIIQIAIDKEVNKIWFGVNNVWCSGRPNIIDETNSEFLPPFLSDITPVLFVVPRGCELEIIDYPYVLPSLYKQAVSVPYLDWYKNNEYKQVGDL